MYLGDGSAILSALLSSQLPLAARYPPYYRYAVSIEIAQHSCRSTLNFSFLKDGSFEIHV